MFIVVENIKATRVKLLKWKRGEFNGTNMDIARVRAKLNDLMNQPLTDTNLEAHHLLVHNSTSFRIVMKHTGDIVQELLGSRTEIETRSFSTKQQIVANKRILFLTLRTMMVFGMMLPMVWTMWC